MTSWANVLVTPDCPHRDETVRRVERVMERLVPGTRVELLEVADRETAERLDFPGSPTVRVGGMDLEGPDRGPPALACRRYRREGSPPEWMVEAAVLRAIRPDHVLFLCVANSARSQMAEGLARSLAPRGVRVSSAGSRPASVRPQAVAVLDEVGVDISGQRSTGIDEVEPPVGAVVTLCAEEVCPVWLEEGALRVHWPFPDPAGAGESEEEELEAFRRVRDELLDRLRLIFGRREAAG